MQPNKAIEKTKTKDCDTFFKDKHEHDDQVASLVYAHVHNKKETLNTQQVKCFTNLRENIDFF